MSSNAMSAAGIKPEELNPYWPNDVISINDRFLFEALRSATESMKKRWNIEDIAGSTR